MHCHHPYRLLKPNQLEKQQKLILILMPIFGNRNNIAN